MCAAQCDKLLYNKRDGYRSFSYQKSRFLKFIEPFKASAASHSETLYASTRCRLGRPCVRSPVRAYEMKEQPVVVRPALASPLSALRVSAHFGVASSIVVAAVAPQ